MILVIKRLLLSVLVVVHLISWTAFAETIHLTGELLPPVTNADGSGQQFEMVKAIFEPLGYDIKTKTYPYIRALKLLEVGQADMMVGLLKDGKVKVAYSKYPHDADNLLAIHLKDKVISWQGIESLKNKNITVLMGLTEPIKQIFSIDNHFISEVKTREQALKKLMFRRTDFIIESYGSYSMKDYDQQRENLLDINIGYLGIYAAFSTTKKGLRLKKLWDEKFIDYIRSPQAKALYDKWELSHEYTATRAFFSGK